MRRAYRGLAFGGLLALAVLYGFLLHRQQWFPLPAAQERLPQGKPEDLTRRFQPAPGASALAQRDAVGALMQIPYLSGYDPAKGEVGVTVYDPSRAFNGWNLCVSAHAGEARLTDMKGVERHRWAFNAKRAWPNLDADPENRGYEKFWRRALLLPGGDLLVIWEYIGMARIDSRSQLKWARAERRAPRRVGGQGGVDLRPDAGKEDHPGDQPGRARHRGLRDDPLARRPAREEDLAAARLRALRVRRRCSCP